MDRKMDRQTGRQTDMTKQKSLFAILRMRLITVTGDKNIW